MKKSSILQNRIIITLSILLLAIVITVFLASADRADNSSVINSFDACAAAGHPIMQSYPEQCAVPGGQTFTKQY